jgi:FkbM family methyltransferase
MEEFSMGADRKSQILNNLEEQKYWDKSDGWIEDGESWSIPFGGTEKLWNEFIYPKIYSYLKGSVLEIAPGHGRMTSNLVDHSSDLYIVDMNESCIDFCRDKFKSKNNMHYYANNGTSLKCIEDNSLDFIFSWDSFVHMQKFVIEKYLEEIGKKLKVGGFGAIHHSNLVGGNDEYSFENIQGRSNFSPQLFKSMCEKYGLEIVDQYDFEFNDLMDCFSFFRRINKVMEIDVSNEKPRLSIEKVEDFKIHFTYSCKEPLEVIISLYSNSNDEKYNRIEYECIEYECRMTVVEGIMFWVSHPSLAHIDKVKFVISDSDYNIIEERIIDDLTKLDNHFINLVSREEYHKMKHLLNLSYWEIFVCDVSSLKKIPEEIFMNCKNVVDLGSNLGLMGKYISKYTKMDNYICVEPNEKMNEVNKIINQGSFKNQVLYNNIFYGNGGEEMAVHIASDPKAWPHSTIDLQMKDKWEDDGHHAGFFSPPPLDNKVIQTTISLADIVKENNLETIDFLKADIEGAEIYLLSDENIDILINKVKYAVVEYHSDVIKNKFLEKINGNDNLKIAYIDEASTQGHVHMMNRSLIDSVNVNNKLASPKQTEEIVSKNRILLKITCVALGDTLCSTPTVRKVSQCYGHKVSVQTYQPDLFKGNPYVDNIYTFDDNIDKNKFDEIFETYNQWIKTNEELSDVKFNKKMEIKLSNFEARQMHALGVGMTLYPKEMSYDYTPEIQTEKSKNINKNYIALHITKSWPNRTWSDEQWQRLVNLIKDNTDFKVVLIGKSHKEVAYFGDIDKKVINLDGVDLDYCIRSDSLEYQENGSMEYNTISELWHVINNSLALVSFDAGPIHLAGTTDTHIVQIGASVDPLKTAPYRKGNQDYKFHFIGGECSKFCSTDPKYSVKEWGTINSMPYYPECQEKYDGFHCQPTPEQVFFKICEIKEKENGK